VFSRVREPLRQRLVVGNSDPNGLVKRTAFTGTDRGLLRSVLGSSSPVPKCEAPGAPISVEEHTPWHLRPPPKSASSASKIFCHSGITVAFKTTFEVFTRVGPDNSLERLTERSVGLVTDRPSNVYELLVTLFE
jgi:hypothetical protein